MAADANVCYNIELSKNLLLIISCLIIHHVLLLYNPLHQSIFSFVHPLRSPDIFDYATNRDGH